MKVVLDSLADDIRREEDSEVQPSRGSDRLIILRGTGFLPRQVFQPPQRHGPLPNHVKWRNGGRMGL